MRKVTQKTAQAFIDGRCLQVGNTNATGTRLLLHGNVIAKRDDGHIYISDAGWQTATTKERLNGLLELLGLPTRIHQKNYVWYLDSAGTIQSMDAHAWYCVK